MLALALFVVTLASATHVSKEIAVPVSIAADTAFTIAVERGCSKDSSFRVYLSDADRSPICYLADYASSSTQLTLRIPAAAAASDDAGYTISVKELGGKGGLVHSNGFEVTGGRGNVERRGLTGSEREGEWPCVVGGQSVGRLELREEKHGNGTNGGGDGNGDNDNGDDNGNGDNDNGDDNGNDGNGDNDNGDDNGNGDNDNGDDNGNHGPGNGHGNSTTTYTKNSTIITKSSTTSTSAVLATTQASTGATTTSSSSTTRTSSTAAATTSQVAASLSSINKVTGLTWVFGLLLTQVLFWGL